MHTLRRWITLISIVTMMVLIELVGFASLSKAQGSGTTTRVSVASDGSEANGGSVSPSISRDGRYVAFGSAADNLVSNDTNAVRDIFVYDRQTLQTRRVSVASDGTQSNDISYGPVISADGRYIAFYSWASTLVVNDINDNYDVFVHDRQTGQTERVSIASDGTAGNGLSSDPSISDDGRFVTFSSEATNLVALDTNGVEDVFVHDRQTGETNRVSIASDGTQGNAKSAYATISANGRYVAFVSNASNLIPNDSPLTNDALVHDLQTGETTRVSRATDGTAGNNTSYTPYLSADGRYVVFTSYASNLVLNDTNDDEDAFVHDRVTGQTRRVSVASDGTQGTRSSGATSISGDGRYVTFSSRSSNLVINDTNSSVDSFVHDRRTSQTTRVSIASDETQGNSDSYDPEISADGRYIVFVSEATNLVSNDINGAGDIFMRNWGALVYNVHIPLSVRDYSFNELSCESQDSEPNNRFSEAVAKPLLCPNTQLIGTANRTNDRVDFFRIHIEQAGNIQIDLTNLPSDSDFDLYLYNEVGGQEDVGNNSGNQNEQIRLNATQGYYFISVVPIIDDPNSATYQLRWSAE